MMNPWDRERTWQEKGDNQRVPSTGGTGLLWLISVIIAVIGLAVMAKHGANKVVIVPIGISLFFMVMFLVSHRREVRRLAWRREVARLHESARNAHQAVSAQNLETVQTPVAANLTTDVGMRKIFDRFDLKVIAHGRMYGWDPAKIASFLDYARDYVDTPHAHRLLDGNEKGELDRHLDAALERALLQHDIATPKPASDEPPF